MSVISTTLTSDVVVGSAGVTSPLSIASTGAVVAYGAAVSTGANAPGVYIRNSGFIESTGPSEFNYQQAVYVGSHGTLVNYGTIEAPNYGAGVNLFGSGTAVNHGLILGGINGDFGLPYSGGSFLVSNSGTIEGRKVFTDSTFQAPNTFDDNGIFINSGFVDNGIALETKGGTVSNSGILNGLYGKGGLMSLTNSGTVADGVNLYAITGESLANEAVGHISNQPGGVIEGTIGIYLGAGIVTNAGTIIGTDGVAIEFAGERGGTIVDDPGSVLHGKVDVTGSIGGELELAAGNRVGTLSGADQHFNGLSSIAVDAGGEWNIVGRTTAYAGMNFTNDGTVIETGADRLTVEGNLGGSGLVILDSTTLALNETVSSGQNIHFEGSDDQLSLGDPAQFEGTLTGFAMGDTIDLTHVARSKITGEKFDHGLLTLTDATGSINLTFANPAAFSNDFTLSAAGSGTDIQLTGASPALRAELFSTPLEPRVMFGQFSAFVSALPPLAMHSKAGHVSWPPQGSDLAKEIFPQNSTLASAT